MIELSLDRGMSYLANRTIIKNTLFSGARPEGVSQCLVDYKIMEVHRRTVGIESSIDALELRYHSKFREV